MSLTPADREEARRRAQDAIERQRQDVHLCCARDFINSAVFALKDAIDGDPLHRRARQHAVATFLRAALAALSESF